VVALHPLLSFGLHNSKCQTDILAAIKEKNESKFHTLKATKHPIDKYVRNSSYCCDISYELQQVSLDCCYI